MERQIYNKEQVRDALRQAKSITQKKRSERTLTDYRRAIKQLRGSTPQAFRTERASEGKAISNSRYRVLKGAYQLTVAERLSTAAQYALNALNEHDEQAPEACADVCEIHEKLWKQKPDYSRKRYRKQLGQAFPPRDHEVNQSKRGKRRYLASLNKNWPKWPREIYKEMPQQHRLPIALLNLTGMRPAELKNGVRIDLDSTTDLLTVTIRGAKVNEVSGQPERKLTFSGNDIWVLTISEILNERLCSELHFKLGCSYQALHQSHQRAVKRAMGAKWSEKISLYSYRHAFGAALKADGYSKEHIALAMGHRNDRSQGYYGLASQAGNGRRLEAVEATHAVKLREPEFDISDELLADIDL